MSLKSIRVLIYIFIQVNWKLVSVHDKSILSIKNEKFKQKKPLNSTKDKQTQAKNKNYYCSYKSSRPDGQPEWSVEVGPVAPSQQQIRNRTKGKRTKSQKRICIIKRKRTKLYLSWSVLSSDQSLQMWSDDYWFRSEEASRKKEWERRRARAETWERGREQEWEIETVIILGIWYFLFLWFVICDLTRFCSLYTRIFVL